MICKQQWKGFLLCHISVANKRRAHAYIIHVHTHTHTATDPHTCIVSLAAIVHRINTHFKNTSSIRSVTRRCVRRVQDTFDTKVARGSLTLSLSLAHSLSAHKPWKCFIQRQQTKLNRTENCVSTVGPGRSAHTHKYNRTEHTASTTREVPPSK